MNIVKVSAAVVFLTSFFTLSSTLHAQEEYDAEAIRVSYPAPGAEITQGTRFKPQAYLRSAGFIELHDIPVRVQIRRCSDMAMVFQSDTTMPDLLDANETLMHFPSKQGTTYDVGKISPGCYKILAIARYPTDENHINDTAVSEFTVTEGSSSVDLHAENRAPRFYPNPSIGLLHLADNDASRDYTITIYATEGRLIRSQLLTSNTIDLTGLPRAAYIIELTTSSGEVISRESIIYK
jgi:hypothetical protein